VSNVKWGLTAGIIAALISVVLGVISGVIMAYILVRALVFLFVFFALGAGIRALINSYFSEILYMDSESDSKISFDQPGSQINITLGGSGEYAVPEMYRDSMNSGELGNIEELISGNFKVPSVLEHNADDASPTGTEYGSEGIDLGREDDYNVEVGNFSFGPQEFESFRGSEPPKPVTPEKPVFTPVFGGDSNDLETLPDLGSMATVFSTGFDTDEATAMPHMGDEAEPSQMQYNKGNKPQPLKGDFNPKELAEGIRTVLKKD
jgi:hypothetical protein